MLPNNLFTIFEISFQSAHTTIANTKAGHSPLHGVCLAHFFYAAAIPQNSIPLHSQQMKSHNDKKGVERLIAGTFFNALTGKM